MSVERNGTKEEEKMKLCVMGLGYIGLPTSAMFASHGCEVVGCCARSGGNVKSRSYSY